MKEIICMEHKCKFWKDNHCIAIINYLYINKYHECQSFVERNHYQENINENICENAQTENDLKGLAQRQ